PAFGTLVQGLNPEAYRGQRIRYSGYVRTDQADGEGAALWMRVDGAKPGETLAFDNMDGREVTGTTEWKKCEIVLDVPKEAAKINFGALLGGKGTAWVDDLQFEKVDTSVPTTDLTKRALPSQPPTHSGP
ncbi:MAG: AraC family transcriptional regulator, partial [Planctomycetota bacterium]